MEKIIDFLNIKENMYSIDENGKVKNIARDKYLSKSISGNGYYTIGLQMKDNSRKTFHIHILVAMAFVPNPNSLPMVNHKDLIKFNCHYTNLEWCTQEYNNRHARENGAFSTILPIRKGFWANGSATYGENNSMSKWTEAQVRKICEALEKGYDYGDALLFAGLEITVNNRYNVSHIARGHRWKRISSEYNMPYKRNQNSNII